METLTIWQTVAGIFSLSTAISLLTAFKAVKEKNNLEVETDKKEIKMHEYNLTLREKVCLQEQIISDKFACEEVLKAAIEASLEIETDDPVTTSVRYFTAGSRAEMYQQEK